MNSINVVVHIINGLPYESHDMMIETIKHIIIKMLIPVMFITPKLRDANKFITVLATVESIDAIKAIIYEAGKYIRLIMDMKHLML